MSTNPPLVGTWRLRSFEVWTPEGRVTTPLGNTPMGYAIFDDAGRAFVQICRGPEASADGLAGHHEAQAAFFLAYFGTYAVNSNGSALSIKVEGSNLASYLGSTQERLFEVDGQTLTLGQPGQYRAVAVRV